MKSRFTMIAEHGIKRQDAVEVINKEMIRLFGTTAGVIVIAEDAYESES